MVGLVGLVLGGAVPELLAGHREDCRHMLGAVAEVCVLPAVSWPTEVAQCTGGRMAERQTGRVVAAARASSSSASGAV